MCSGGCDVAVVPRRCQSVARERGRVAGVNDVMHEPRMVGVSLPQRIEHRKRLALLGEAGVVRRRGGEQRERVERPCVGIVGIAPVERAHGRRIGVDPRLVIERARCIEAAERGDVRALARALRRRRRRLLQLGPAAGHRALVGPVPYLVKDAHRRAPVCDGTLGVGLGNGLELPLRLVVPKIVQQCDGPVERRLHRRASRRPRMTPFRDAPRGLRR